jgi:hypothetical protein
VVQPRASAPIFAAYECMVLPTHCPLQCLPWQSLCLLCLPWQSLEACSATNRVRRHSAEHMVGHNNV